MNRKKTESNFEGKKDDRETQSNADDNPGDKLGKNKDSMAYKNKFYDLHPELCPKAKRTITFISAAVL